LWLRVTPAGAAGIAGAGPCGLVGVEPDLALQPLPARRAVTGETAQVLAHQVEHRAHATASSRSRTAFACASNPSAPASVTAQGPMPATPAGVASCTLMKFWKLATDTPLQARAAPLVGSTWLVPLQ